MNPPLPQPEKRDVEKIEFSVVIPARNEEKFLPRCLQSIQEASREAAARYEIVVVLNRCTDRTEEIARAAGAVIVRNDGKNLSHIRNTGVRAASSDWIVTIDADSRMSRKTFLEVRRFLSRPSVIGGGVVIVPERLSLGILATGLYLLPIALFYRISGGLFFFRRDDFEAIGGFDEGVASAEDIDFAKRLKAYGKRTKRSFVTLLRAWIVTSCRKFDTFGDWYFALRPWLVITLIRGRHQAHADRVWYDFPRD